MDRIADAITPKTRAIVINSPSNPTGWTATMEELQQVLDLSRKHGLWIISDEIYGRFVYDGSKRAPSFHDIMNDQDRIMFAQTFSKNWAMTGWRIGWLECPVALGPTVENLIQYSSSGVAAFLQRAGIAALQQGESFVEHQIARAREGREIVSKGLADTGRVTFGAIDGAFYLFFKVEGIEDTRKCSLWTRPMSGWRPVRPSGPAPSIICGCALPASPKTCARRPADWPLSCHVEAGVRLMDRQELIAKRNCKV